MNPPGMDHGSRGDAGGHAAHNKHAGHDPDVFRRQFWIVLLLTIPVVIWSHEVMMWLGYTAPEFPGSEWVAPIVGTIVFLYGGRVFLEGARTELGDRQPGMMTLIAPWQVIRYPDRLQILVAGHVDATLQAQLEQALIAAGVAPLPVVAQQVAAIPRTALGKAPLVRVASS